jgi:PAS domain S-box-containing protein
MSRLEFTDLGDVHQLQHLTTPLWIFDVDRNRIWWANNQGLAFWKARSVEELRKRDFSSDSATVRKRLRQIVELATEDTQLTDTWTIYPADDPKTVILSFRSVLIESEFQAILIELKRVLDRDDSDDTWRLLEAARATSLMISTFSLEGELLSQNPASLACYGKGSRQKGHRSNLDTRFQTQFFESRIRNDIEVNETKEYEVEVVTSKGLRTHSLTARRGRDPITGDFVIFLTEEDVTERANSRKLRQAEQAALETEIATSGTKLKDSQERYELAVQTASIWDWDAVTDQIFMSPKFVGLLGYTEDQFAAKMARYRFTGFLHHDDIDQFEDNIKKHLQDPSRSLSFEVRILTKHGGVLWFHCQGKSIFNAQGKVTRSVGLLTDVSDRKTLETNLLASQRLEAVGQLTGGIAHDFNNLLTVIQGNAELLEAFESKHTDLTSEIISAVKRGADLTRHLLAFAKQQTLIPRSLDLKLLIPEMDRTLLRAIGETVSTDFQTVEGLWNVHADQTQLEAAILNLALNARDAMQFGGTLTITCCNRFIEDIVDFQNLELDTDQYVEITVQDNGHGMTPTTLAKSFEPFFTTKGVGQGSGLGLSMVLGFARQSNGDARIQSVFRQGTKVSLYLPKSDILPTEDAVETEKIVRGKQEHIHILEDNENVQEVVAKIVASLGYQVTTSSNVDQAEAWVQANMGADLYLVDILLPGGKSGVDFAAFLRQIRPRAKMIYMSGFAGDE